MKDENKIDEIVCMILGVSVIEFMRENVKEMIK